MNYDWTDSSWIRATRTWRLTSLESLAFIILISRRMSPSIQRRLTSRSGRASMASISLSVILSLSFVVCKCMRALGG